VLPDGYELRSLQQDDAAALAAAYRRNRDHLAPWDPTRPERYFTDEGQSEDVAKQLEAEAGGGTPSCSGTATGRTARWSAG
jgi:ribosomal-protein-alanine N-acetyltransferase